MQDPIILTKKVLLITQCLYLFMPLSVQCLWLEAKKPLQMLGFPDLYECATLALVFSFNKMNFIENIFVQCHDYYRFKLSGHQNNQSI